MIQGRLNNLHKFREKTFYLTLDEYRNRADTVFDVNINIEEILEIQKNGFLSKDEAERKIYRDLLFEKLSLDYSKMEKNGFRQMHFHFPDSTSFLRFHAKDKFGDNLTAVRKSVVHVNSVKKPIYTFEEGKIYNSFRAIYPLFYQNEHIGSVEISSGLGQAEENLEKVFGGCVYFIFSKEKTDNSLFGTEKGRYETSLLSNDFYHDHEQIKNMGEKYKFIEPFEKFLKNRDDFQKEIKNYLPFTKYITIDDKHYNLTGIPLSTFNNDKFGYVIFFDREDRIDKVQKLFRNSLFIFLIMILVVSVVFYKLLQSLFKTNSSQKVLTLENSRLLKRDEILKLSVITYYFSSNSLTFNNEARYFFSINEIIENSPLRKYLYLLDFFKSSKFFILKLILDAIKLPDNEESFECVAIINNEEKFIRGKAKISFEEEEKILFIIFQDITAEKITQKRLEQYLKIIEESVITSKTDIFGKIIYASQKFSEVSGFSKNELLGNRHSLLKSSDTPQSFYQNLWKTILSGKDFHSTIKNRKKSGEDYWLDKKISPEFDFKGEIIGFTEVSIDITDRIKFEELSKTVQTILDSQPNMLLVIKGRDIFLANAKFLQFVNVKNVKEFNNKYKNISSLFIKSDDHFYPGEDMDTKDCIHKVIADYSETDITVKMRNISREVDEIFHLEVTCVQDNLNISYILSFTNITNIIQESIHYKWRATHDLLTETFNKSYFNEVLKSQIHSTSRYGDKFSIIIFDIDHFKNVNDTYGHLVRDKVLITLSKSIKMVIRDSDVFARWGGEEFVILTPHTDEDHAYNFAEKLRKYIENIEMPSVKTITSSFGVTQLYEGDSVESAMKRCDDALYRAKKGGRNRVEKSILK
jgi:diguanylate cyclase (GGDEF)-like protein/PAS domain S-box-containing protein